MSTCDHRALQRALLCVQLDPAFGARVLAREPAALAATGLAAEDLARLVAPDPRALFADREGRRRAQVLGNSAGEYRLSVALARTLSGDEAASEAFVLDFGSSPELHQALRADRRLPLAFGAYAERRARAEGPPALLELVRLERTLCELRRAPRARPAPGPGEVVLAPRAELIELASGTHALAGLVHAALARGARPRPSAAELALDAARRECLLLFGSAHVAPGRLPEIEVEPLEPAVAALLARCRRPLGREARARQASLEGASSSELEAFVASLVDDGVLVRG